MADIKLESDYWETSGIRDRTQNKTQRQINASLQADITDIQSDIGDMDNLDTQATNLVGAANELKGSLNTITPFDTTPTSGSTKGITSGGVHSVTEPTQVIVRSDLVLTRIGKLRILTAIGCPPSDDNGTLMTLDVSDRPRQDSRSAICVFPGGFYYGWIMINKTSGAVFAQYTNTFGGSLQYVPQTKNVYGQIVWAV